MQALLRLYAGSLKALCRLGAASSTLRPSFVRAFSLSILRPSHACALKC
jgi:hypothetical protein